MAQQQINPLYCIRHSAAHLLAAAVQKLYPEAKFGVGPVVENGFYYDIDFGDTAISVGDLSKIENEMELLKRQNLEFERQELPIGEAIQFFQKINQPYKIELLNDIKKHGTMASKEIDNTESDVAQKIVENVSLYKIGDFFDLCRGNHVKSTKQIGRYKLVSIAGAYWRGDENNPMLTRIYGVVFETKDELKRYLTMIEESQKRDHRKLGKELDLFTFSELVGAGFPLYTPKGSFIRRRLNDYIETLQASHGYTQVWTPQVAKAKLFQISGHYDKYKGDMFRVVSNHSKEEFYLKPMNCPQHTQIFASQLRSYRDLPIRLTDFSMLYRDEKPGELNGLARVRSFSQDDCHIFCREDQVNEEIDLALSMTKEVMQTFGFKYRYRLSTRDPKHPEKYLGDQATWDKVEKCAVDIMKRNGIDYFDGPGEAAFYAPKMDLMATDALGREWQLSTIQIDYVMPERFGLKYIDNDGKTKRPVMIHRAIIGSPERFMMILLEHFAGAFPVWLSPVQVVLATVAERFNDFAQKLAGEMSSREIRVEVDDTNESIGNKVRKAAKQKIPFILVIGEKEVLEESFQVRERGVEKQYSMSKDDFIEKLIKLVVKKSQF